MTPSSPAYHRVLKDDYPRNTAMTHQIVFLCVDGFQLIDLAGPMDVFDTANRVRGQEPYYRLTVASPLGGAATSSSGLTVQTELASELDFDIDTLVVIGSFAQKESLTEKAFTRLCVDLSRRAERLVSICNGAFALGAAGLLNGHRVTTHWSEGEELATACPAASVDPGRIYVRDGSLYTSGGATSGIDLALALVAADLGVNVARTTAKWLVVFLRRPGGQSQFSSASAPVEAVSVPIEQALKLIHDDPSADHSVGNLASQVGLSRRHFARVFKAETGATVARHVESIRVERATVLLESTELSHEAIATHVGFNSGEAMRQVFHRERGISPSQQRERFTDPTHVLSPAS